MSKKRKTRKSVFQTAPDLTKIKKESDDFQRLAWQAVHYAKYDMSEKQLKKAVMDYLKSNGIKTRGLGVLADREFVVPGRYAYILNGGGELPESMAGGFGRVIDALFAKAAREKGQEASETKESPAAKTPSVQDRMRSQAEELACEFDDLLDKVLLGKVRKVTDFNPSQMMTKADFKAGQARWIKKFYKPELDDLKSVLEGKDTDLKEGYSNLKKAAVKRGVEVLDKIIEGASIVEKVTKAKRKPRKRKAPNLQKQVAKLKYMEKHEGYGIASEAPIKILGAKAVWVFNTKYRKIGQYIAADESGLSVKGASITNFAAASTQKTLRKPKEQLKEFNAAGKVKLRKYLDGINAVETKLNGRMNNNIVILRVVK